MFRVRTGPVEPRVEPSDAAFTGLAQTPEPVGGKRSRRPVRRGRPATRERDPVRGGGPGRAGALRERPGSPGPWLCGRRGGTAEGRAERAPPQPAADPHPASRRFRTPRPLGITPGGVRPVASGALG